MISIVLLAQYPLKFNLDRMAVNPVILLYLVTPVRSQYNISATPLHRYYNQFDKIHVQTAVMMLQRTTLILFSLNLISFPFAADSGRHT